MLRQVECEQILRKLEKSLKMTFFANKRVKSQKDKEYTQTRG